MCTACPRPCPVASAHRYDLNRLRAHLEAGHCCADTWIALSHIVNEPWQRLECLERAAALDPDDLDLQIARLEHFIVLHPDDAESVAELRAARARRAIANYRPRIFRQQDSAQPIGAILRALQVISNEDIEVALEEQERYKRLGHRVLLGDLLVANGKLAPEVLARALTLQCRIRAANRSSTHSLGEYLIAHGSLTPEQLEDALREQIELRKSGRNEPLGEILLRQGVVDVSTLRHALRQQMSDAMAAFI